MRRKDREVTDAEEIRRVLDTCKVCRVGMSDEDGIYIVPVNYAYILEDRKLTLYVHGAQEGRKAGILKEGPAVGIELDCGHELVEAEKACGHSYHFSSIIGSGRAENVLDKEEKKRALGLIMRQQTDREFDMEEVPDGMLSVTAVTRIDVSDYTCKKHS